MIKGLSDIGIDKVDYFLIGGSLIVNDMLGTSKSGKVALWVEIGTIAFFANSLTFLVKPNRFNWLAFLITGTMRLPDGKAVAIPILISSFKTIFLTKRYGFTLQLVLITHCLS